MKVLKNPGQVLQILSIKLKALHKRFDEADGDDAAEISGKGAAIISIQMYICYVLAYRGYFGAENLAYVYDYINDIKDKDHEYSNPRDTWFMNGRAKGAAWALKEIEKRIEG